APVLAGPAPVARARRDTFSILSQMRSLAELRTTPRLRVFGDLRREKARPAGVSRPCSDFFGRKFQANALLRCVCPAFAAIQRARASRFLQTDFPSPKVREKSRRHPTSNQALRRFPLLTSAPRRSPDSPKASAHLRRDSRRAMRERVCALRAPSHRAKDFAKALSAIFRSRPPAPFRQSHARLRQRDC